MKKLNILKAIVDLFWIVTMLSIPFILFLLVFVFISDDISTFNIKINDLLIEETNIFTKITLAILLLTYLLLIYGVYLFKKSLVCFQRLKIFDEVVINNFNKIGYILVSSSFLIEIPSFLYRFFYKKEVGFEIGFSSFILMLCSGFFFMILSEIFKISKKLKEDNELTI